MSKALNPIFKVVLCLAIIRHFMNIPLELQRASSGLYDEAICYVTIALCTIMIITFINILRAKRGALSFFWFFQFFNGLMVAIMEQQGNYLVHFIVSVLSCGVMAGLLCLKRDGISGWKVFYPSKEK